MIHIALPDSRQRRLVFYLAMEEYVARHISELPVNDNGMKEAFFMWQVPPTVIFGRNQVMEAEVNMPYCKSNGVQLYRRKSGGGCVYADMGNIMLSYISDSTEVAFTFDRFLQRIALLLRNIGLDAERSGRNDVLVDGKKVSGNAFFLLPKASIVHGTLLFDSDFDALQKAITPSDAKIRSKGVESVRQHVINLREAIEADPDGMYRNMADISLFKEYLLNSLCGDLPSGSGRIKEYILDDEQVRQIEEIEAGYLDPDFLNGKNHSYSIERKAKLEEIGEMVISLDMNGDTIGNCHLSGDFFPLKDGADTALTTVLKGRRNVREEVAAALEAISLEHYILKFTNKDFIDILFGEDNIINDTDNGRKSKENLSV